MGSLWHSKIKYRSQEGLPQNLAIQCSNRSQLESPVKNRKCKAGQIDYQKIDDCMHVEEALVDKRGKSESMIPHAEPNNKTVHDIQINLAQLVDPAAINPATRRKSAHLHQQAPSIQNSVSALPYPHTPH